MKKILLKIIFIITSVFLVLLIYISTFGIKTDKLNNQISSQINNINEDLEIQLEEVSIFLDPFKFKIKLKSLGVNLNYKKKKNRIRKNSI